MRVLLSSKVHVLSVCPFPFQIVRPCQVSDGKKTARTTVRCNFSSRREDWRRLDVWKPLAGKMDVWKPWNLAGKMDVWKPEDGCLEASGSPGKMDVWKPREDGCLEAGSPGKMDVWKPGDDGRLEAGRRMSEVRWKKDRSRDGALQFLIAGKMDVWKPEDGCLEAAGRWMSGSRRRKMDVWKPLEASGSRGSLAGKMDVWKPSGSLWKPWKPRREDGCLEASGSPPSMLGRVHAGAVALGR